MKVSEMKVIQFLMLLTIVPFSLVSYLCVFIDKCIHSVIDRFQVEKKCVDISFL